MDILKIALWSVCVIVLIAVVKQLKPEFTVAVIVASSTLIMLVLCDKLYGIMYTFYNMAESANVDSAAVNCIIKVVGIGYIAEFSNNLCVDADCKSVGDKVLLAGKIAIVLCALPIIESLFENIKSLFV